MADHMPFTKKDVKFGFVTSGWIKGSVPAAPAGPPDFYGASDIWIVAGQLRSKREGTLL